MFLSRVHVEKSQPLALSQSALSELLDAIRASGSSDVIREAMTLVLQQLIELEADQAIGAGRGKRGRHDDARVPVLPC